MPTYDTSDRYALRALEGDNPVSDIDAGFAALRDDISAKLTPYDSGLLADRPVSSGGTPGKAGRIYLATDDVTGGPNGTLHVDYGTGWLPLLGTDTDLAAIAALTTTTFGRSLLTQASAPAAATTLGIQQKRVSGQTISAFGVKDVTLTWPTAFADTNYTATVALEFASGDSEANPVARIASKTTTAIVVRIYQYFNASLIGITVHGIAVHD